MPTILLITVGGSCVPVITAIRGHRPDFICFIASTGPRGSHLVVDGPGDPCGDHRHKTCKSCGAKVPLGDPEGKSIVAQLGLQEDRYKILPLDEPDSMQDCFRLIRQELAELSSTWADARFIADYTGGTKTMSVALSLAALEAGAELSLVKGTRTDLLKPQDETEIAAIVNTADVHARRRIAQAMHLFNDYEYDGAAGVLGSVLSEFLLRPELQNIIKERVAICRAFDAWDRFDHHKARQLIEPYQSRVVQHWIAVKQLTSEDPGLGYTMACDLLNNAQRRASHGRYDDAVARLYRTLELLAQTRLLSRSPSLDSADLDIALLPGDLQNKYAQRTGQNGAIKLGLVEDFELLVDLDDPVGELYSRYRGPLLDVLQKRNHSIMAHGLNPLEAKDWEVAYALTENLVSQILTEINIDVCLPQFPIYGNNRFVLRE